MNYRRYLKSFLFMLHKKEGRGVQSEKWQPLETGLFKVNFDGAVDKKQGRQEELEL